MHPYCCHSVSCNSTCGQNHFHFRVISLGLLLLVISRVMASFQYYAIYYVFKYAYYIKFNIYGGKLIFLKGLFHDQTKFHKPLLKPGFVKLKPSVQCLSWGRESVGLSSNAARRNGMSHYKYICHGCGNN